MIILLDTHTDSGYVKHQHLGYGVKFLFKNLLCGYNLYITSMPPKRNTYICLMLKEIVMGSWQEAMFLSDRNQRLLVMLPLEPQVFAASRGW